MRELRVDSGGDYMSVWTCDGCEEGCVVINKGVDSPELICLMSGCHINDFPGCGVNWTKVR